ncbi:MAG: hypothetical protein V3U88_03975 [Methylococcales bacterium]
MALNGKRLERRTNQFLRLFTGYFENGVTLYDKALADIEQVEVAIELGRLPKNRKPAAEKRILAYFSD